MMDVAVELRSDTITNIIEHIRDSAPDQVENLMIGTRYSIADLINELEVIDASYQEELAALMMVENPEANQKVRQVARKLLAEPAANGVTLARTIKKIHVKNRDMVIGWHYSVGDLIADLQMVAADRQLVRDELKTAIQAEPSRPARKRTKKLATDVIPGDSFDTVALAAAFFGHIKEKG